jgi:hypothetical protein
MTKFFAAIVAASTLAILASPSEARPRAPSAPAQSFCGDRYCPSFETGNTRVRTGHRASRQPGASRRYAGRHPAATSGRRFRTARSTATPRATAAVYREAEVVAHPAGCPSRAFCGCGASIEVFGRSIRELWRAANWFRFPPASPAAGMVAVRYHHVFVIREVLGSGLVLAYDANSGGHRTRIHVRSLAGYSVRNPRGGRYASAI